jgi:class 3 adenylate cyclase/tetratricopeptide (TPR) repeat protein
MKEHRKLAAIMFTDIVGYSTLMSKDEKNAMGVLEKNRHIHKSAISRFNGEFIKEIGDGTLAIFPSSLDAVSCAIRIMKSCRKESSFSVRIGIHIGDIIIRDGDVFGDGVNIASRIEAGGKPGGIYISERVYEDIKNKDEIKSSFVEERMLKNIDFPVKIFAVDAGASTLRQRRSRLNDYHESGQKTRKHSRKLVLSLVAITVVIISVTLIYLFTIQEPEEIPQRIVVALFENRTGDPNLDELGKITCDWITRGLSQTKEIEVVPSTTVIQISGMLSDPVSGKRQNDYLEKLAKETIAQVIISGSYYIQNETLQFQAEIKDVTDGKLIYSIPVVSAPMDRSMELIEKVNSELSGGIAYHFKSQQIQLISKPPSITAYSEYIAGLEYFGIDYKKANYHFIKSVENDSLFMQPRFFMASSFSGQGNYFKADSVFGIINRNRARLTTFERYMLDFNISFIKGDYLECLHYLNLAEVISPGDRQTNYLIGLCALRLNKPGLTIETYAKLDYPYEKYSNYQLGAWRLSVLCTAHHLLGEYDKELTEARKGQQYFPYNFWFYEYEASAYAGLGKINEIASVIEKCRSITSKSDNEGDVILEAAIELRAHGHAEEAEKYFSMAGEWFRNHPVGPNATRNFGTALYLAGNYQESQSVFNKLAEEFPDDVDYIGYMGVIAARLDQKEEAIKYDEALRQIVRPYLFGRQIYWRARIAALMGEPAKAVTLLNESFAGGNRFGGYIHQCIDFECLLDYEPFKELMKPKE